MNDNRIYLKQNSLSGEVKCRLTGRKFKRDPHVGFFLSNDKSKPVHPDQAERFGYLLDTQSMNILINGYKSLDETIKSFQERIDKKQKTPVGKLTKGNM